MFYHDSRLQYEVRAGMPDALFATMLQQAIGGIEGEIRVGLQYLFQAWAKPPSLVTYRGMLLHTGTEEFPHIEMLWTGGEGITPPAGRWTSGPALDGKGAVSVTERMEPQVPEREEPPYTLNQAPTQEPRDVMAKAVETVHGALS